MIGGFNGKLCAQWVCSMGIYYGLNWSAQWENIMCSTGNYWCAQWETQWEVMCSTGHYWCAQLDVIGVLNGKLGAQWEVMCSMGNYNVLNWILLECSMGSAPWEINGVHIVVLVNNIPNVKPFPSRVLSHMNLMCGCCMEGWIELRTL